MVGVADVVGIACLVLLCEERSLSAREGGMAYGYDAPFTTLLQHKDLSYSYLVQTIVIYKRVICSGMSSGRARQSSFKRHPQVRPTLLHSFCSQRPLEGERERGWGMGAMHEWREFFNLTEEGVFLICLKYMCIYEMEERVNEFSVPSPLKPQNLVYFQVFYALEKSDTSCLQIDHLL